MNALETGRSRGPDGAQRGEQSPYAMAADDAKAKAAYQQFFNLWKMPIPTSRP